MSSILIRRPKRCSSCTSSSTNWNESRTPVSRRSVSGDGISMWKLSTNTVPRRSMMAFRSCTQFLPLTPPRYRAGHTTSARAHVIRRQSLRLRRAEFGVEERFLQPGTVDLAVVVLRKGVIAHPAGREHVRGHEPGQVLAQAFRGDGAFRHRGVGAADQPSFEAFG